MKLSNILSGTLSAVMIYSIAHVAYAKVQEIETENNWLPPLTMLAFSGRNQYP